MKTIISIFWIITASFLISGDSNVSQPIQSLEPVLTQTSIFKIDTAIQRLLIKVDLSVIETKLLINKRDLKDLKQIEIKEQTIFQRVNIPTETLQLK